MHACMYVCVYVCMYAGMYVHAPLTGSGSQRQGQPPRRAPPHGTPAAGSIMCRVEVGMSLVRGQGSWSAHLNGYIDVCAYVTI